MTHSQQSEANGAVSVRLVEAAVELVRAELALVAVRARQLAWGSLTAVLATILAAALVQVALVVGVLSPLLLRSVSLQTLLVSIAVPAGLALASLTWALLCWRGVRLGFGSTTSAVGKEAMELRSGYNSPGSQRGLTAIKSP